MHGHFHRQVAVIFLALVLLAAPAWAGNLTIDVNYSDDTNNFFSTNPEAEVLMNNAASFYESIINANLSAIDPAAATAGDVGTDSWTAQTFNPANTTQTLDINNPTIAANTIVVYVGGSNLTGGSELGLGGFGGYSDSGFSQSWFNTVQARGVAGALGNANTQTAYAPWGGSISFSLTGNWYFGTSSTVPAGEYDFYSVALHELGHVLGLGTSNVWNNDISGSNFTGVHAVAANGGTDPGLSPDLGHWVEGTQSDVYGTNTLGYAVMTPALPPATRNLVTNLDVAGLQDVGWAIIPEPATYSCILASVVGLYAWQKKKSRSLAL
jgi:hypothetical protein